MDHIVLYPSWEQRYSGEAFDRAQALAERLTDDDRKAGRPAPVCGYSAENFRQAEDAVRLAQTY